MSQIGDSIRLWSASRMVQNQGRPMVGVAYLNWRSVWISSIVMPSEGSLTKDAHIVELKREMEMQEKEWAMRRQELQNELAQLKVANDLFKGAKEFASKEVESLKKEVVKLRGDLQEEKKICLNQKSKLKNVDKMKHQFKQLKRDYEALKQERQVLEEEVQGNHAMKKEMVCSQNAYQNLLADYGALQKELEAIKHVGSVESTHTQGQIEPFLFALTLGSWRKYGFTQLEDGCFITKSFAGILYSH